MTGNIHGHNELHMTQIETTSEVTASVNFLILYVRRHSIVGRVIKMFVILHCTINVRRYKDEIRLTYVT